MGEKNKTMWEPSAHQIKDANVTHFRKTIENKFDVELNNYQSLHSWSIENPEAFWDELWDFAGVIGNKGSHILDNKNQMIEAKWFTDSTLNFAENLMRFTDESAETSIVFWGEDKIKVKTSKKELKQKVAALSAFLQSQGVKQGDVVAGFIPNMPEAVIAMLATASLGAIWTSCSPDFGVQGVLDRFGQVNPKVLIACNAYYYNGKTHDCLKKIKKVREALNFQYTVIIPYSNESRLENSYNFDDIVNEHTDKKLSFTRMPFNAPLYIMFSSGTTGKPKCIVHGIGGTLLQHLKEHLLHVDLKPKEKIFYFSTCGWMMWNWLVSALALDAKLMLYDGSPFFPNPNILIDFAEKETFTVFGTSAKYLDALKKEDIDFTASHNLSQLKSILSTGSVLAPENYDYVYGKIKSDLCLSSISGGTDIISCFALGSPILPVNRGELQCKGLGLDVQIWDSNGKRIKNEKGELVCAKPFPSMPIYFWNDKDNRKYKKAYFSQFKNVWCHGDYVKETDNGGLVFYGRSDTVLNPGGVRIGTAEIYRQVEKLDEVQESIVIGQEWQDDVRVVLFVMLKHHMLLDDDLAEKIKKQIRNNTTPRHVPAKILQVKDIPRTKSGKIVELAVRKVVHGDTLDNLESLANPEALQEYKAREELSS